MDKSMQNFNRKRKISITVNINDFIRDLLRLILKGNMKFSAADDLGDFSVFKQILQAFGMTFNQQIATEFIMKGVTQMYSFIAKDIICPSLLLEAGIWKDEHVIFVSVRYLKNGKICDRLLGILNQTNIGSVSADQLTILLSKIGKTINDIYLTCSIINDNGYVVSEESGEDDMKPSGQVVVKQEYENDSINVVNGVIGTFCTKMFCGADVCALVAKNVTNQFDEVLQEMRKFTKNSWRSIHYDKFMRLRRPRRDIAAKWETTYQMIRDFNQNKTAYKAIPDTPTAPLKLDENTWNFIPEYLKTFEPVHSAWCDFQRPEYTMSDFYIGWIRMELQMESITDGPKNLKSKLLKAMKEQSQKFLDYDALVAALILDPRFQWNNPNHKILNDALRDRGIDHLMKVHQKLNFRHAHNGFATPKPETLNDNLTQLLGGISRHNVSESAICTVKQQIFKQIFSEPRVGINENFNILQYWHLRRDDPNWNYLYKISQVVYGGTFSQFKDRHFTAFEMTHTDLPDKTFEAVFIVKNNLDLLESIVSV